MALETTNISTSLVGTTLGTSSRDVGTLCTHTAINMWSKRKPVRDGRIIVPLGEVGKADNCGLTLYPFTGDDTLITYYNRPGTWVDQFGQHTTPFRLGDFRGYEHSVLNRPVTIGAAPDELQRKPTAIYVSDVMPANAPVVSFSDFTNSLRLGVVVYGKIYTTDTPVFIGCASTLNQLYNFVPVDLTDVDKLYLDVKFCMMDGYIPWTNTMPSVLMYEIPRQYPGENKNWTNVPLVTPPEEVKTFEIAGFISSQSVQYIIEAYTTTTGKIKIIPSTGSEIQIANIQLPANTRVSATANNINLISGVTYTAELYLGNSTTPVALRPMSVN